MLLLMVGVLSVGVYTNYGAAFAHVVGVSNAVFKKFASQKEAFEFIRAYQTEYVKSCNLSH